MPDDRPNVLWITTDQQRLAEIGCYGDDVVDTPNIDRLAAEGTRFTRAYAQNPICAPSRGSFLTGRYPRTNGLRQNGQRLPEDEVLVTRLLSDADYACGLSGKLHIAPIGTDERPRGFEGRIDDGYGEFHWSHDPGDWASNMYHNWLREKGVDYGHDDHPASEWVSTTVAPEHHQTTWCAQKAINFIEGSADDDEPWLWSVNPFDPHHPFDPPEELLEKYLDRLEDIDPPDYEAGELEDKPVFQQNCHEHAYTNPDLYPFPEMDEDDHLAVRAAYYAMVDLVDQQVGRMLDALEETGQREDTLVVFMSDHGEMLGDHGIYLKGPFLYEQLVNVPLICSQPGTVPEDRVTDEFVELVDLAPTLLDAAGEDPHPGMQGHSIWDFLRGESDTTGRDWVYSECYNSMAWQNDPKPFVTMVRNDRYKLSKAHGLGTGELYDLQADPGEHENLWDDPEYAEVKTEMLSELADRIARTADPLPEREAPW